MPGLIEDYGLIGDLQTAALVGGDGSIDHPQAFSHVGLVNTALHLSTSSFPEP